MVKNDHKEIWLEPEPPMDDDEVGRTWCQDNVYDPYDYDGNKPTRYIRADLYEELQKQVERLKNGFQGACYCCEPVGMQNLELQKRVDALKALPDKWRDESVIALENHGEGAAECVQECADELEAAIKESDDG